MYQVECIFKGYTVKSEMMTKMPIEFIKSPNLFIQDFKVVTQYASNNNGDNSKQYYFELGVLLLVKENEILVKLLEQISKTVTDLVGRGKIEVISSDVGFEYYNNEEQIPPKHLLRNNDLE